MSTLIIAITLDPNGPVTDGYDAYQLIAQSGIAGRSKRGEIDPGYSIRYGGEDAGKWMIADAVAPYEIRDAVRHIENREGDYLIELAWLASLAGRSVVES